MRPYIKLTTHAGDAVYVYRDVVDAVASWNYGKCRAIVYVPSGDLTVQETAEEVLALLFEGVCDS